MAGGGIAVPEEGLGMSAANTVWKQHGRTDRTLGQVIQFFVIQMKISTTVEIF